MGRVERARALGVRGPVADGEELPLRVVEEAEVHPVGERGGARPASVACDGARASTLARSPSASAMSAPARLPLSTVET